MLDGYDRMPCIMMGYTPPYYINLAEKYGFRKAKDLYALYKNIKNLVPPRIKKMIDSIKKKTGVVVRNLNMKNFERDIKILKDIYNSEWEKTVALF